jgi:hypothetical protein
MGMSDERVDSELKAHQAFAAWVEEGKRLRRVFDETEQSLPAALARMFGETENGRRSQQSPALPIDPPKPKAAMDVCIWVPENDLTAAKLALAILRDEKTPITASELFDKLKAHRPDAIRGTVFNIGPRLEGDLINRTADGWMIREPSKVPVLTGDGYAWGPPAVFTKTELAGHRRTILCHVLGRHPEGLQIVPLVREVEELGVCRAPLNKDLVKGDFEILRREGKVRRKPGAPKKWILANEGGAK